MNHPANKITSLDAGGVLYLHSWRSWSGASEFLRSAASARMAIYYPEAPCAVCGQSIGTEKSNILAFDFIEIPERDFQHFGDGLAHISCVSSWERRDEFIEAWNRALSEYYVGKELRIDGNGRVAYTDSDNWHI